MMMTPLSVGEKLGAAIASAAIASATLAMLEGAGHMLMAAPNHPKKFTQATARRRSEEKSSSPTGPASEPERRDASWHTRRCPAKTRQESLVSLADGSGWA